MNSRVLHLPPLPFGALLGSLLLCAACEQPVDTLTRPSTKVSRFTPAATSLNNLNAQLSVALAQVEGKSPHLAPYSTAVDLLHTRSQFLGSFADLQTALDVADATPAQLPEKQLLQARALQAIHEFRAAEELLRPLLSSPRSSIREGAQAQLRTIDLALFRNLQTHVQNAQARFSAYPSYQSGTQYASLLAAAGEFEAADQIFTLALEQYRDVSALPYAWVEFQRGVMWAEQANEPQRGRAHYVEAVRLLPQYVVATVHLAELTDSLQERRALLEGVSAAQDPEPLGKLASLLARTEPQQSRHYADQAAARYEKLMLQHPRAFLDHAAEFYTGPGADPERALKLALDNLSERTTPRSYVVAIQAAQSAEQPDVACALKDQAFALAAQHPVLDGLLTELSDCL